MNLAELIRTRRSVRTFDGKALSQELKHQILAVAQEAANPYEIPISWRLLDLKEDHLSTPVIVGADTFLAGKMEKVPHAEEAFGFSLEGIVLKAWSLGLGTTWIAGTMDRSAFERAMKLTGEEVMPCVTPLGFPAPKMSIREGMMRKGVRADERLDFSLLFFEKSFDTPLTPERAGEWAPLLEMVRRAPSAVNRQPWRVVLDGTRAHFYERRTKGYVGKDGWDLQKIDMGIALCHLALGLEEKSRPARLVIEDPGIPMPADTLYIASYLLE